MESLKNDMLLCKLHITNIIWSAFIEFHFLGLVSYEK